MSNNIRLQSWIININVILQKIIVNYNNSNWD